MSANQDMMRAIFTELSKAPSMPAWIELSLCATLDRESLDEWTHNAYRRIVDNIVGDWQKGIDDETADNVAVHLSSLQSVDAVAWLATHPGNVEIMQRANCDYGTWEMFGDDYRQTRAAKRPDVGHMIALGELWMWRAIASATINYVQQTAEERTREAVEAYLARNAPTEIVPPEENAVDALIAAGEIEPS